MTKANHKRLMELVKKGSVTEVYYCDIYCGTYTNSWKVSEIKEDAYKELKARDLLLK